MPKITSTRAKTVAAPKKPAPRAKTKTEKKVTPKSTGWSAKTTTGGTRRNTAGTRGSDVSTPRSRERVADLYAGGRGSDTSTRESRQRIADIYAGGRSSGSSYSGGGRNS